MGISDINSTLKKVAPDAFMEVPLANFSGYAIAIDANLWLFKAKSAATKDAVKTSSDPLKPLDSKMMIENIKYQFHGFVFKLCSEGITPVWVFDGATHQAKIACQKRKAIRDAKKIDIESERKRIEQLSLLERTSEIPGFVKKLISSCAPTRDEGLALRAEAESLGVPVLQAPHDAEIYASALSRSRLVAGVWTTDTDTYAAGALLTITGFSEEYYAEGVHVKVVVNAIITDTLGITREELRDLCIMHECDFNKRIPKLGPVTILKMLERYEWNLDRFIEAEPDRDWDCLNLKECREIFDGPDVSGVQISDLVIDRSKWHNVMRSKTYDLEIPPEPRLVELL